MSSTDKDIKAIQAVNKVLSTLNEDEIMVVLSWANAKYGKVHQAISHQRPANVAALTGAPGEVSKAVSINMHNNEISGIALLNNDGELKLTLRDLKAKSTNDAAIRLVHIIIYAYEKLTGESSVSSKKVVSPILKEWRAYSGNTRNEISKHRGIVRSSDLLSLDTHSKMEAERYINEILDEGIKGNWNPSASSTKKRNANKGENVARRKDSFNVVKNLDLLRKSNGEMSLKEFVSKKSPKSNLEKNTIFVHYLKHIAKINNITADHVYSCYKNVTHKVPNALKQSLVDTGIKGWIDTKNMDNITLVVSGENLVEHELPRKKKE